MHVFEFKPNSTKWPTHVFKKIDSIIVRAQSEIKARQLLKAVTFTSQSAKMKIGQIHNPWQNPAFSKCEIYQGPDFTAQGEAEVLSPPFLRDHFIKIKAKIK